jgi:hypothetical protein
VHFELNLFPLRRIHSSDCRSTPATGFRNYTTGALTNVGTHVGYWSSSTHASDSPNATFLRYWSGELGPIYGIQRANGFSVRCVQHLQAAFFEGKVKDEK